MPRALAVVLLFALCATEAFQLQSPLIQAQDRDSITTETVTQPMEATANSSLETFERRILPILRAQKPSSCVECHLSGVDLKDYIHPDQGKTFASLVRAGMVDVKEPDKSKILEFIARKPKQSSLISDKIRQEEYEAFRAWLKAAIADPQLLAAKDAEKLLEPKVSIEVIRHARKDRVLASFTDNIWNEVGRCAACHSPDRNQKQVEKHGEQVSWIKLGDPEGTLNYVLGAGLIDREAPEKSLLLTKPTKQVEHGGGQKMVIGDRSYKQFRRFIDDYAAVVNGKYKSAMELPSQSDEVSIVSEIWLKLTDVPAEFDTMLLQVDVHRWEGNGWSKARWATSDRPVFGKGQVWQHSLSLTAPRRTGRAEEIGKNLSLPRGRYLIRVYLDRTARLKKDFRVEMGQDEFVGEIELQSNWPSGYGQMTVVPFPRK